MPKLMVYRDGDVVPLTATVVSGRDQGGVILDIGGAHVPISSVYLDKADLRPSRMRELTDEETDRAEMARVEREARMQAVAAATPPPTMKKMRQPHAETQAP